MWLWTPNRVDNIPQKKIASFYPGDDVRRLGRRRRLLAEQVHDVRLRRDVRADARPAAGADHEADLHRRGRRDRDRRQEGDLDQHFFKSLPLNPDIIGFSWFSLTVAGGTGETTASNDWRINSSDSSVAAFRAGIADPRYGLNP